MTFEQIHDFLTACPGSNAKRLTLQYAPGRRAEIYPRSINRANSSYYFIAREDGEKYFYAITPKGKEEELSVFSEPPQESIILEDGTHCERRKLNHAAARAVKTLFDFATPRLIGIDNSVGLGDRLGIANPGHLRAVMNSGMKVILAQQSIRELERTGRTPDEVMDAAVWAVLQEGWREGFGADADHLKTEQDVDLMLRAGYTMITIDPGEYVRNNVGKMSPGELARSAAALDWQLLGDTLENCLARYTGGAIQVSPDFSLSPGQNEVLGAFVKYGGAVLHTIRLHRYILKNYSSSQIELELSVDETDSDTTPFEHYFIVNELKRAGVSLVSLAPRFVGGFEKGIDYQGNLDVFIGEYVKHVKIAELLGPYKISYHSGSDKFSVYEAVGRLKAGRVHVKTAGTSYLEALHTIAVSEPGLFRRIYAFSRACYETEKRSYHVSADIARVPESGDLNDSRLEELFVNNHVRQVLHVAFGKVLTAKDENGKPLFKGAIMNCLEKHEETHYRFLEKHFRRHIEPFL